MNIENMAKQGSVAQAPKKKGYDDVELSDFSDEDNKDKKDKKKSASKEKSLKSAKDKTEKKVDKKEEPKAVEKQETPKVSSAGQGNTQKQLVTERVEKKKGCCTLL